jgi:hypothetical protein
VDVAELEFEQQQDLVLSFLGFDGVSVTVDYDT